MSATITQTDVRRHDDLTIPVGSNTVAATRYEPVESEGPSPALLMYVPYHKDDWITYGSYNPLSEYLASRGFEVVVADMVGTGASTGNIDEMLVAQREGEEAVAIIEWLADREWTTGSVGMYGKSYGGITSLAAAAQRPEALDAIVPIETPYLGYRNCYTYGGHHELQAIGMDWLTLMQVLDVKPPSRRDDDGQWLETWRKRLDAVREREPWIFQFYDHERKDEYWADKDIDVDRIDVPTLAVGGYRDPYPRDTVDFYERIDAPKRLLFGPWRHSMPHRGFEEAIDFREQVADWFDYYLRGEGPDPLDEPSVQFWTELDGSGERGIWEGLDEWPTVENTPEDGIERFALTDDGATPRAAYETGDLETRYEFDQTVGLESTVPYRSDVAAQDTSADDARSLCFETEPFDEPRQLTGSGAATVRLESTVADPSVTVRVVDVAPDGTAKLVTDGTVRATRRNGLDRHDPLDPGEEYEITVPLTAKSHVFESGHRLRVAISASYFPLAKPVGEDGSFLVRSSPDRPSEVALPMGPFEAGGRHEAIEMGEPAPEPPASPTSYTRADVTWETARERTSDRGHVRKEIDNVLDMPHVRMHESGTFEATVEEDDPSGWTSTNSMTVTLKYDDEEIEVRASNRLSETVTRLETTVLVDGEPIFDEYWTRIGGE